ncbi:MAG: Acyl-CoA thioesterase, partial [Pseudomonadota bacterium]
DFVQPLTSLATPLSSATWLWYEVEISQASQGYGHSQAKIYSPNGQLLVQSHQLVVAYA